MTTNLPQQEWLTALVSEYAHQQQAMPQQVVQLGKQAVPGLMALIDGGDRTLALAAARLLCGISYEGQLDELEHVLLSEDPLIASIALKALKTRGREGITVLSARFAETNALTQYSILKAVAEMPGQEALAIDFLIEQMQETTINSIRYTAIQGIGRIGEMAHISLLEPYLDHPDHHVRDNARAAIDEIERRLDSPDKLE